MIGLQLMVVNVLPTFFVKLDLSWSGQCPFPYDFQDASQDRIKLYSFNLAAEINRTRMPANSVDSHNMRVYHL